MRPRKDLETVKNVKSSGIDGMDYVAWLRERIFEIPQRMTGVMPRLLGMKCLYLLYSS